MDKKELRKRMKCLRDSISAQKRSDLSKKIADRIFNDCQYAESQNILIYVSIGSEAETYPIIEDAMKRGKRVAVPRIDITGSGNKLMNFYEIKCLEDLEPGFYGIPEPKKKYTIPFEPDKAIVIMPGLVFDKNLNRIGYGGGYYDRYLAGDIGKNYMRFGIAFDFQITEERIDTDRYDVTLHKIFTENEIYG